MSFPLFYFSCYQINEVFHRQNAPVKHNPAPHDALVIQPVGDESRNGCKREYEKL